MAEALGRLFVSEVVHARSESQNLQWRVDAQAMGAHHYPADEVQQRLEQRNYLRACENIPSSSPAGLVRTEE